MHSTLHDVAVGLTALAACVHPGWRSRAASPGLVAAILMLAAMVDVAYLQHVASVLWAPLLLAAALVLSATGSPRRRGSRNDADGGCTTAHDSLGLVAMAVLLLLMGSEVSLVSGEHAGHGPGPMALTVFALAIAGGHVAWSIFACARGAKRNARVQLLLMAGATAFMAAAALA